MLTLTTKPGTDWPQIMRAFQHMVKFLRKASPELQYAACKEEGSANGMKHLHVILLNFAFTPQVVIAARWRQLTGAHVLRIERLRSDRAHFYVAKYVSKDLTAARKHVTFSRGFPPLPPSGHTYTAVKELPAFGPSKVRLWTDANGIVDLLVPDCDCFGEAHEGTLTEHLWLRSLQAHSPPVSPAS